MYLLIGASDLNDFSNATFYRNCKDRRLNSDGLKLEAAGLSYGELIADYFHVDASFQSR